MAIRVKEGIITAIRYTWIRQAAIIAIRCTWIRPGIITTTIRCTFTTIQCIFIMIPCIFTTIRPEMAEATTAVGTTAGGTTAGGTTAMAGNRFVKTAAGSDIRSDISNLNNYTSF